jgi:hypothetical protein
MGLDRLSLEARVLYSAFSLFLVIGVLSSAWLYHDDALTLSPAAATRHYLGDASSPPSDNPLDAPVAELALPKSARQVMETFHFHLFSVPVCLLIIGHLFMMTSWRTRAKVAWLVAASLSTLGHLLGPPLIRFASSAFSALFVASAAAMLVTWLVLLCAPLWQMWRARPPAGPADE